MLGSSRRLLALFLVGSLCSCSFFLRGVEKDHKPEDRSNCQDFIAAPIADGAIGGLFGLYGATQCGRSGTACLSSLAVGAVFLGAAVWGTLKIMKCRDANRAYQTINLGPSEE